uniref:Uncharacterized protein n=1 Tax=Tanacetum cinerariifolium TaxID=118510 RepID=A0A6L2KWW1_TANCI|nr:hypothetical protein [Tanacetum cinerariifolium]
MRSTCINPSGLIFMSKDIKNNGEDGFFKGIDLKAVHLLFAAAKIVNNSISAAHCEMVGKEERLWGLTLTRSIVKKVPLWYLKGSEDVFASIIANLCMMLPKRF